jgi:hypothetical protein
VKEIIFLLGAGASMDAGMPTVVGLTNKLRENLPNLRDVNGNIRLEFGDAFDYIAARDPSVAEDYERFFEWIELLTKAGKEPFRKAFEIKVPTNLTEAVFHIPWVLGEEIARILESYQTEPSYLAKLGDFTSNGRRLKVFSLNYDCCLEDACGSAGIDITTGFNRLTKKWQPSLFQTKTKGINLYKLHGSLRWFSTTDNKLLEKGLDTRFHYNLELKPDDRAKLPQHLDVNSKPDLVLGPGTKLQVDDPFLTLFHDYHRTIRRAKAVVVLGYGHRDPHVEKKLEEAIGGGAHILDVNPGNQNTKFLSSDRYHYLKMFAKDALMQGGIKSELEKLAV